MLQLLLLLLLLLLEKKQLLLLRQERRPETHVTTRGLITHAETSRNDLITSTGHNGNAP